MPTTIPVTNVEYHISHTQDKFWQVACFINNAYHSFRQYKSEAIEQFVGGRFHTNIPADVRVTYRLVPLDDKTWQIVRDFDGQLDTSQTQPVEVINEFLLSKVIPFDIVSVGDVVEAW